MTRVSVVIPTRNRRELMGRTLAQVLGQEGVDLEVLIVDEASSDDTVEWLHDLADPRIRVLRHEEPQGVSNARNHGLAEATAPWVAFTDDDDLWAPDKLAAQLDAVAATPGAGWSCVGAVSIDEHLRVFLAQFPPTELHVGPLSLRYNVVPGGGSGVLARTDLARRVGGFDARLSMVADWDMWIRLGLAARLAPVDRPLLGYLVHGGGMSRGASRARWEFREVERRYRHLRVRGEAFPWEHYLRWMAEMDTRAGKRVAPMLLHLERGARAHDVRSVRRAAGALVAPQRVRRRADAWMMRRVPLAWQAEADAWLADLRPTPATARQAALV